MNIEEFITIEEAMTLSGYTRRNITDLCKKGKLPGARKMGKQWLVPKQALENYTPGPRGFAAVWEKIRAEEAALRDEIKGAVDEARGGDEE